MTEKVDGIRAFWDGQKFISKMGNEIKCPHWLIEEMPQEMTLDGELWLGRGTLEILFEALKVGPKCQHWQSIKYIVFDLPHSKHPYEHRMEELRGLSLPSMVSIAEAKQCQGNEHLLASLKTVIINGGEGLMVNRYQSLYQPGYRTDTMLKVKVINLQLANFVKIC
jgi:DNA ligase-1